MTRSPRPCMHCGRAHRRRGWYCTDTCRFRGFRRRKAGLPENVHNGEAGGRRGRVPLSGKTNAELRQEIVAETRRVVQSFLEPPRQSVL